MPEVAEARARPAALIKAARRITVKVGSSLLVEGDGVRRSWLASLGQDIGRLRDEGRKIVIVSSGAVALGRRRLSLKNSARLALKQASAASGQPLLMRAWEEAVAPFGIPTAQLLLTLDDTESRRRWLNARASHGHVDMEANWLTLDSGIDVFTDTGYTLHTERADVDLKRNIVTGDHGLSGQGPLGTMKADTFQYDHLSGQLVLKGHVQTVLTGRPK